MITCKFSTVVRRFARGAASLMLIWGLAVVPARAQDVAGPAQTQTAAEQRISEGQIEQLVAPIALYPDPLLTQVLMASTYPLEVVEAARWSRANPAVTGTSLEDAMQAQSWDPSIKALTAVPQMLLMMSTKLDWTQQLGDAFLAQQQDVLDAVQKLRAEARAAGNLQSTPQQVVTTTSAPAGVTPAGLQQAIVIEPVNPDVYYVPIYNPAMVYGAWGYPDYLPFYWYPPGFVASNIVSFAAGVAVGSAIWGGCDWWNHNVFIDVNRFNTFNHTNINNNIWVHNPAHRGNVPYHNAAVAQRFGRDNTVGMRDELRDHLGAEHPNEQRLMTERPNEQRLMTERPNDQHLTEGDRDFRKDVGSAPLERRQQNIERDLSERLERDRPERSEALPRPQFDRPRVDEGADMLRRRSVGSFRPRAHAFGGFRGHFGGLRRL